MPIKKTKSILKCYFWMSTKRICVCVCLCPWGLVVIAVGFLPQQNEWLNLREGIVNWYLYRNFCRINFSPFSKYFLIRRMKLPSSQIFDIQDIWLIRDFHLKSLDLLLSFMNSHVVAAPLLPSPAQWISYDSKPNKTKWSAWFCVDETLLGKFGWIWRLNTKSSGGRGRWVSVCM